MPGSLVALIPKNLTVGPSIQANGSWGRRTDPPTGAGGAVESEPAALSLWSVRIPDNEVQQQGMSS